MFSYFNEIGIIAQLSSKLFEQALPDGLTQSQFSVLNWFVRVDTKASPGRLSKAFQVTKGAMTNTLNKLEAKGCIEIKTDASNGRQKIVTMTERGKQLRLEALQGASELFELYQAEFSTEFIQSHIDKLIRVRQFLDQQRDT